MHDRKFSDENNPRCGSDSDGPRRGSAEVSSPSNSFTGSILSPKSGSPRSGPALSPMGAVQRMLSSKGGGIKRGTSFRQKGSAPGNSLVRGLSSRGKDKHRQRQQSMRKGDDDASPPTMSAMLSGILFRNHSNSLLDDDIENATFSHVELGEKQEKSFWEVLRIRAKIMVSYTWYGKLYDWFTTLLSVLSCFLFIYQTYSSAYGNDLERKQLEAIEVITAAIFSFDFLLSLFIADHRWEYLRRYGIYEYKCELLLIMFNVFVR